MQFNELQTIIGYKAKQELDRAIVGPKLAVSYCISYILCMYFIVYRSRYDDSV